MAFLIGGANSAADTGFSVANSVRIDDGDSAYMHNTLSSGDGSDVKGTISFWTKRGNLGTNQAVIAGKKGNTERVTIGFSSDDYFEIQFQDNSNAYNWRSTAVYRDIAAWYNFVIHLDTGNATANSRARVWVNNSEITSWGTREAVPQSLKIGFFNGTDGNKRLVGARGGSSVDKFYDGYIAEVVVLNNALSAATNFGEYNEDSPNIWQPIDVSGLTFGTHGFYLDFEASDNLGNDANGGADFTEVNLAATDQTSDSPTNNFCTMNHLDNFYFGAAFSEGNLKVVSTDAIETFGTGTMGVANGKWYWEVKVTSASGYTNIGIASEVSDSASNYLGEKASKPNYMYDSGTGDSYTGGSGTDHGDTYTDGDIISVALNLDDNEINYYKNGTVQNSGTAVSITAAASTPIGFYLPAAGDRHDDSATLDFNFGNPSYANSSDAADANGYGAFEYAPPSGFLALCTKNLGSTGG